MKKKLFEKKIIKGLFPLILAIVLVSVSFQACEKDELLQNNDSQTELNQANLLKSASISAGDIDALITKIENFIISGDLESGLANAFIIKLENAKKSLEKGNEQASTNQLQALMNQVKGLLEAGTIEASISGGIIFDLKVMAGENPTFTDTRDNHEYKTIKIGDQVWLAENLAYETETGSYTYNNFPPAQIFLGRLYTWEAAFAACPAGWHLPSDAEWVQLTNYLIENGYGYGGSGDDIAKALAASFSYPPWNQSYVEGTPGNNTQLNNSSGFSAIPAGIGLYNSYYYRVGENGYWWSANESYYYDSDASCRTVRYDLNEFYPVHHNKLDKLSVRCIRD